MTFGGFQANSDPAGDLGNFAFNEMQKPFSEAAFQLQVGGLSFFNL